MTLAIGLNVASPGRGGGVKVFRNALRQASVPMHPPAGTIAGGWPTPFDGATGGFTDIVCWLDRKQDGGDYRLVGRGKGPIRPFAPYWLGPVFEAPGGSWTKSLAIPGSPGDGNGDAITLRIQGSDPADPIRDLELYGPGDDPTYGEFHRPFVEDMRPFACLRFLDWSNVTGNLDLGEWPARSRVGDTYTYALDWRQSVPLELQIAACNAAKCDLYLNLPLHATAEYIRESARLIEATLDPSLKAYVEFHNELWNGGFAGLGVVSAMAAGMPRIARQANYGGWDASGYFSGLAINAFRDAFRDKARVVRVQAMQCGNNDQNTRQLAAADAYGLDFDAMAQAPYFTPTVARWGEWADRFAAGDPSIWPEVAAGCRPDIAQFTDLLAARAADAHARGKRMICYEGGLALQVGERSSPNMRAWAVACGDHPIMRGLYEELIAGVRAAGADLFLHYTSNQPSGLWGTWGPKQRDTDPDASAPRWTTLKAAAALTPKGPKTMSKISDGFKDDVAKQQAKVDAIAAADKSHASVVAGLKAAGRKVPVLDDKGNVDILSLSGDADYAVETLAIDFEPTPAPVVVPAVAPSQPPVA